jgi:hypothetical protein
MYRTIRNALLDPERQMQRLLLVIGLTMIMGLLAAVGSSAMSGEVASSGSSPVTAGR